MTKESRKVVLSVIGVVLFAIVGWIFFRTYSYSEVQSVPGSFCRDLVKIYEKEPGDLIDYIYEEGMGVTHISIHSKRIDAKAPGWDSTSDPVTNVHVYSDSRITIFFRREGMSFDLRYQITKANNHVFVVHEIMTNLAHEDESWLIGYFQDQSDVNDVSRFMLQSIPPPNIPGE